MLVLGFKCVLAMMASYASTLSNDQQRNSPQRAQSFFYTVLHLLLLVPRPVLSFDASFDAQPHTQLLKEQLAQVRQLITGGPPLCICHWLTVASDPKVFCRSECNVLFH